MIKKFTLIEQMVMIAIIGIQITLLMPALHKALPSYVMPAYDWLAD